ncbi:hypothetical protein ACFSTC_02005 [Nonomuraea ferruginea]
MSDLTIRPGGLADVGAVLEFWLHAAEGTDRHDSARQGAGAGRAGPGGAAPGRAGRRTG